MFILRRRLKLKSTDAMYVVVHGVAENRLVTAAEAMFNVYDKYIDEDGFLYFTVTDENWLG